MHIPVRRPAYSPLARSRPVPGGAAAPAPARRPRGPLPAWRPSSNRRSPAPAFPELTVEENIGMALESASLWRRIDWRARRRQARELLEEIGRAAWKERG